MCQDDRGMLCTTLLVAVLTAAVRAMPSQQKAGDHTSPCPGDNAMSVPFSFFDHDTLTALLSELQSAYPDVVEVRSVGSSAGGRELWLVELGAPPSKAIGTPTVVMVNNMHGDEILGRYVGTHMAFELASSYACDERVRWLLDNTRVAIMPSMNPDGFALGRRENLRFVDLNRDFPEFADAEPDDSTNREVETASMMTLLHSLDNLAFGFNTHGGALVCNYPYDSASASAPSGTYNTSPDDELFVSLCTQYANAHPTMHDSFAFPDGITNGNDWYEVRGGLQDYSYRYLGTPHVTLELSVAKAVFESSLAAEWDANREPTLQFFEAAHQGVRGFVGSTCAGKHTPLAATVQIFQHSPLQCTEGCDETELPPITTTNATGTYHRILLPGNYRFVVTAENCTPVDTPITVPTIGSQQVAFEHNVTLACPCAQDNLPGFGTCGAGVVRFPLRPLLAAGSSRSWTLC